MPDIRNEQILTRIFGRWPSFHDAEILSILLDRSGEDGPSLTAKIHVWEMTREVDAKGHLVLKNHTLAVLKFGRIALESLKWFNTQNVLWELEIKDIDSDAEDSEARRYQIFMPTSHGCEASFQCGSITVVEAEPYSG